MAVVVAILLWLIALAVVTGPLRSALGQAYNLRNIEKLGGSVPLLTFVFGLPAIGIGSAPAAVGVGILIWGIAWLGPIVLLVGAWRAPSPESLSDWVVFGGTVYMSVVVLLGILVAVGLWLPYCLA